MFLNTIISNINNNDMLLLQILIWSLLFKGLSMIFVAVAYSSFAKAITTPDKIKASVVSACAVIFIVASLLFMCKAFAIILGVSMVATVVMYIAIQLFISSFKDVVKFHNKSSS